MHCLPVHSLIAQLLLHNRAIHGDVCLIVREHDLCDTAIFDLFYDPVVVWHNIMDYHEVFTVETLLKKAITKGDSFPVIVMKL